MKVDLKVVLIMSDGLFFFKLKVLAVSLDTRLG